MSARPYPRSFLLALIGVVAVTGPAFADDPASTAPSSTAPKGWRSVTAPVQHFLQDPLQTVPQDFQSGHTLPQDKTAYRCAYFTDASDTGLAERDWSQTLGIHPLSLAQAIDIALCHNLQIQQAWAKIKVQAAALGEARAAYLPTLTGGITRLRSHTHYENSQQPSTTTKGTTEYLSLTWRLFDFGGRAANERSSADLLTAALADHNEAIQKTLTDVIQAYFDAQTAQATLLAKKQIEFYAEGTLESSQRKETQGAGSETDTLQAKTALAKAMLDRSRAQGTLQKNLSILRFALGLPENVPLTLGEDVVDPSDALKDDLNTWLTIAKETRPAIVAAQAQVASAREQVTVQRSAGLPSLDLTGSYYRNGIPNQGLNLNQSDENFAGFTLNLPIFSGFDQTYKIRGAEAQVALKEAALLNTQHQTQMEVVKAYADARASLDNLAYSQNLLTAAQQAVATVQRKFNKGASDILEVLNTQSALSNAQEQRIQCLAEWRSARLRLLSSVGSLGRDEVQQQAQVQQ